MVISCHHAITINWEFHQLNNGEIIDNYSFYILINYVSPLISNYSPLNSH